MCNGNEKKKRKKKKGKMGKAGRSTPLSRIRRYITTSASECIRAADVNKNGILTNRTAVAAERGDSERLSLNSLCNLEHKKSQDN